MEVEQLKAENAQLLLQLSQDKLDIADLNKRYISLLDSGPLSQRSAIAKVRYHKGPGWTGLDTNNLFLLNCRRERQTSPNPNPNPGLLR